MIYIQVDDNNEVIFKHFDPFNPEYGMGKTEEELKIKGFLVEEIVDKKLAPKAGFDIVEKFESETGIYYEYKEKTEDTSEKYIKEIYKTIIPKKDKLEQLISLGYTNVDEIKEAKRDALKEQCTAAIHAGFKSASLGKEFGFNEHDQSNFTQQLLLIVASGGQYTNPIAWKSLDGEVNTLTTQQFNTLVQEATAHKVAQQQAYWLLESRLNEATTKEEIIAIEWQVST